MKAFHLSVKMKPLAKQSFKVGRFGGYKQAHVVAFENAIRWEIDKAMKEQGFDTMRGPIRVTRMLFCFRAPANLPAAVKKALHDDRSLLVVKPTRPDFDNLQKAFWDAANGLLVQDDAQVVTYRGLCGTFHSFYDRIEVVVEPETSLAIKPTPLVELVRTREETVDGFSALHELEYDDEGKKFKWRKDA